MHNDKERRTYHLWELTTKTNSQEVYELAQVAAEIHTENHEALGFRQDSFDEDAQGIVYAVHRKLWEMPRQYDSNHPPYTHRVTVSTSIVGILRDLFGNLWGERQRAQLAKSVYAILSGNQLAIRVGEGGRANHFYIRAWPDGISLNYIAAHRSTWLPFRDEVDIQRQEKKAELLAGPVTKFYSLKSIPPPEPNPQSVMKYLERLKGLIGNLERENQELRTELSQLKEGDWNQVVDAIKGEET